MALKVLDALKAAHPAAIELTESINGDEIAWVKRDELVPVATWLRDDPTMLFDSPVFATCIDRLDWRPVSTTGLPLTAQAWPNGGSPAGSAGRGAEPWNESKPRFEVVYQLRSHELRHRLRLKISVPEHDARCPSLATLWPAFDWQERETFDMYGIRFDGHPDLRRIYLYEEFVGYPLRKDYPKEKRQPLVRRDDLPINPIKSPESR